MPHVCNTVPCQLRGLGPEHQQVPGDGDEGVPRATGPPELGWCLSPLKPRSAGAPEAMGCQNQPGREGAAITPLSSALVGRAFSPSAASLG